MHRGDGGRPLTRGQTWRRGLGLAAVGSGSDLWLPPSSCEQKRPLITRLVVMGFGGGQGGGAGTQRFPFKSLQKWLVAGESSPRGLMAPQRGRVMGRAPCSRVGGRLRWLGGVSVPPGLLAALWVDATTEPWSASGAGAAAQLWLGCFSVGSGPEPARGSARKHGSRDGRSVQLVGRDPLPGAMWVLEPQAHSNGLHVGWSLIHFYSKTPGDVQPVFKRFKAKPASAG